MQLRKLLLGLAIVCELSFIVAFDLAVCTISDWQAIQEVVAVNGCICSYLVAVSLASSKRPLAFRKSLMYGAFLLLLVAVDVCLELAHQGILWPRLRVEAGACHLLFDRLPFWRGAGGVSPVLGLFVALLLVTQSSVLMLRIKRGEWLGGRSGVAVGDLRVCQSKQAVPVYDLDEERNSRERDETDR